MATVRIPRVLQSRCSGKSEFIVGGTTVRDALNEVRQKFPHLYRCVCDETDTIRQHIHLFLNDDVLHHPEDLETQLEINDVLSIFQAVSGG